MMMLTSGGTPGSPNAIPRQTPRPAEMTIATENVNKIRFHSGLASTISSSVIWDVTKKSLTYLSLIVA